ncbi:MAG TPA: DUF167 family protein [Pseudomonadales bacterium]|nr:DUF167 family protein [Pseudomonadales bacterium]
MGSTLFLNCYLQPRASKNEIVGRHGEALKIRLTAPPVDGKANAALLEFLSAYFSVPLSSLTLQSGHTARIKRVKIEGLDRLPSTFETLCSA